MVAGEPYSFRIFQSSSEVRKLHTVIGKKKGIHHFPLATAKVICSPSAKGPVWNLRSQGICVVIRSGVLTATSLVGTTKIPGIAVATGHPLQCSCCKYIALGTTRYHVVCSNSCLSRQVSLCQRTEAFHDPKPSDNPVTIAQAGQGSAKDRSSQTFWKG